MKRIADIRSGLDDIPDCFLPFSPEVTGWGVEPGTRIEVWNPDSTDDRIPDGSLVFDDDDIGVAEGRDQGSIPDFEPVFEIGADVDETFPALEGELGDEMRRSVLHTGTDALGYYISFHVTGAQWGIHIPVTGIAYLINTVFKGLPLSLGTKAGLAFKAIHSHELFHFATDYTIAQAELAFLEPWWKPAKLARNNPSYNVIEERLANAYMLKAFRSTKAAFRVQGKQQVLRDFTKKQPVGYSEGWEVRRGDWENGLEELAHSYGRYAAKAQFHRVLWNRNRGYDWAQSFPISPRIDWRYCPIHILNDSKRLNLPDNWISILSRLPAIQETPKFLSSLSKMGPQVQKAWNRTKERLQTHITAGADFKKWTATGQDVYSVRVNDGVRAHLQGKPSQPVWTALDIGNHKAMGHG